MSTPNRPDLATVALRAAHWLRIRWAEIAQFIARARPRGDSLLASLLVARNRVASLAVSRPFAVAGVSLAAFLMLASVAFLTLHPGVSSVHAGAVSGAQSSSSQSSASSSPADNGSSRAAATAGGSHGTKGAPGGENAAAAATAVATLGPTPTLPPSPLRKESPTPPSRSSRSKSNPPTPAPTPRVP